LADKDRISSSWLILTKNRTEKRREIDRSLGYCIDGIYESSFINRAAGEGVDKSGCKAVKDGRAGKQLKLHLVSFRAPLYCTSLHSAHSEPHPLHLRKGEILENWSGQNFEILPNLLFRSR
jgi:hypothetical protein